MAKLKINGALVDIETDGSTPLLWVLREQLGLTGTKYGCGIAACGVCTVHVDGRAVRSCVMPLAAVEGKQVTTIEGLGGEHPVQRAWIEEQVPQCGYCQSGMLMTAAGLLARHPEPTEVQIKQLITNLCRCGTYPRVRAAIQRAARALQGERA